jgi:hypothetical protein
METKPYNKKQPKKKFKKQTNKQTSTNKRPKQRNKLTIKANKQKQIKYKLVTQKLNKEQTSKFLKGISFKLNV